MCSKRLPGKVLMKIKGKEILQHIIDFLKLTNLSDQIIVATSKLPEDDKICKLVSKNNLKYFRGSTDDVLERYYACAKTFKGDIVVRMGSDDPIVNPEIVDRIIKKCKDDELDYVSNSLPQTYPYGYSTCEAFTFKILKKLHETRTDPESREHVTSYIRNNPELFKIGNIETTSEFARPKWRVTIDYEEDFKLVSKIFSQLYDEKSFIDYDSLVKFLDHNKELLKINKKFS
jgi:spore coat polysaccharide biosynthesis protein SpsF